MKKSLRAAIISLGSKSSKWTYEAMKDYFEVVDHINIKKVEINLGSKGSEILVDGEPLGEYDCIYSKGSFRYADVLGALKSILQHKCYMPVSGRAYSIGHDKVLSHIAMQPFDIPMPITYLSSSTKAAKKILKRINYPIIMKLPRGTQGKGVMFAESYSSASSLLDTLEALRQPFLIQEYIDTGGEDIRAIVIGDKVVAAMKRIAKSDEKRANIHAGASSKPLHVDARTQKISVETARAIGSEICAVDILESVKGPVVIEVNLSPGLQGITKCTNINVADKIAKYLHKRTVEYHNQKIKKGTTEIMNDIGIADLGKEFKEIITNLDIRSNRILLPELMTNIARFSEKDEIVIRVSEGKIEIEKFKL